MKIRKQQLDTLNQQQANDYEFRLTRFLQGQFAGAAAEPVEKLRAEIVEQIIKARSYGLLTEQEVASYVITAWLLGQNFDQDFPAAQDVLTAPVSGNIKAHFLEQWTRELFEKLESGQ